MSRPAAGTAPGGTTLGQVFYGSLSGERNFRILADSGGLSRDERDVVRHYSNLGGSAQTAADPPPVWAAYPLAGGRRAFSRTVFLGAGGRGNDYLAHVLVVGADTLAWLRGDLFLLADAGLFSAAKPAEDAPLDPLPVDRPRLERASQRRIGADARFPLAETADLLRALADGPVALSTRSRDAGADLCRSALSCLPPDDRRRLSFCSRFSHPRRAAFHLAVHLPDDAALVEDGLVGFDRRRNELPPAADATTDPFAAWLHRAADEEHPLEPLTGLSVLARPAEAVATAAALDDWMAALPATTGGGDADGLDPETAARRGDPVVRRAQQSGLPLLEVARHPLNRRLPGAGRLLLEAAVHSLVQRVGRALAGDAPFAEAADACLAAAEGTRPTALLGRLIGLAREAPAQVPAPAAARQARHRRAGSPAIEASPVVSPAAYAAAVCAVTVGGAGGARAVYSRLGDDALWRSPAEAAADLAPLAVHQPRAFLGLATAWFAGWRELEGPPAALDEIGPLLGRLAEAPEPTLNLALRALEEAAPPAEDGTGPAEDDRRAWHLALMRRLRADLGAAYPTLTAARLAVEAGLLGELTEAEADELTPALVAAFPERLSEALDRGDVPWPILRRAVSAATAGLLSRRLGGDAWDLEDRLQRWPLAARLAAAGAAMAAERADRALLAEVAWLVWAATRLVPDPGPGTDPLAAGDALDRHADALDTLVEAGHGLPGGAPEADVALRALWRLRHLRRYEPRATPAALAALRDAALAASLATAPPPHAGGPPPSRAAGPRSGRPTPGTALGRAAGFPPGRAPHDAPPSGAAEAATTFAALTRARVAHLAAQGLFAESLSHGATGEAAP